MARPTFDQFRKKALRKPGVRAEYDALAPAFEMKGQMIARRQAVTQEQRAAKLRTRKSNSSARWTRPRRAAHKAAPFCVEPVKMGALLPGRSYDNIGPLLEDAEGHGHR
jgi:hypothetical protein